MTNFCYPQKSVVHVFDTLLISLLLQSHSLFSCQDYTYSNGRVVRYTASLNILFCITTQYVYSSHNKDFPYLVDKKYALQRGNTKKIPIKTTIKTVVSIWEPKLFSPFLFQLSVKFLISNVSLEPKSTKYVFLSPFSASDKTVSISFSVKYSGFFSASIFKALSSCCNGKS